MLNRIKRFPTTICGPFATVVVAIFVTAGSLSAQQSVPPALPTGQSAAPGIPSYPNSTKGLEKMVKDMMKLLESGDTAGFTAYTEALAIPHPEKWFVAAFGDEAGPQLAEASERRRGNIQSEARIVLTKMKNENRKEIRGVRFEDACNDAATSKEYPVLLIRAHAEPLFDVRMSNGRDIAVWGLFAYVDDGFRFLGDLFQSMPLHYPHIKGYPSSIPAPSTSEPVFIRLPGKVQDAKIISRPIPTYPAAQKHNHEQGIVVFHAVIGKDGRIHELRLVEGTCAFAEASIAAVTDWRYYPTRLNDNPVEVDTTITVQFTLQ